MDIPYTVTPRADTGVFNAKLGVWLFLASEVMLFGGLFSAYVFLRLGVDDWPGVLDGTAYDRASDILNVPLATLNTMVLIASSVTMVMAWASLMMNRFDRYKLYMGLTILAGLIFLVIKYFEYSAKLSHGLTPSDSNFLAIYFTLTGLHGLHVIGGLIVNGYFWGPGSKMWKTNPAQFTNRIEIAGLYWHFVDLVWIFLFPTIYLI
ncbi:MAG TPA: cytochrome c oxidase subunit 3 [Rhodothermales bacterium]|nr:cytochrome c oxidase subunit 3 [Rhodothermales bacterium]